MKKINKSQPPNPLTKYAQQYPTYNWETNFRNYKGSSDYNVVKQLMLDDQGGICGYCEKKISDLGKHKQRVEHYHSKSDKSNPQKNWALDWTNVFAVCLGGSDANTHEHPLPVNLSCDAHKDHLITANKLPIACEGYYLNPLLITSVCLFDFDKSTGALSANKDACQQLGNINNQYQTMEELVQKTIDILNLNCQRLLDDRLQVLKSYNQHVKRMRESKDTKGFSKLAQQWFSVSWPSFFTTRRILLSSHAETYLNQVGY